MSSWVRLWRDMPTDPKWRVIAKKSGRPLSEVLSVFMFMMSNAGANAIERGVLENWSHDDIAAALDTEPGHVAAIYDAMQGKTLDGDRLTGWEKRQPKREDGAAERAKQWRERNRTQPNGHERPDSDADSDKKRVSACATPKTQIKCDPNGVTFDGTAIHLDDGNRAFWLDAFGNDSARLELALLQAAGYIQPHGHRPLYAQVGAQLARSAADKRDRDKRYETAAASRKPLVGAPVKRGVSAILREMREASTAGATQ